MKKILAVSSILMVIAILETDAQKIYHSSGMEIIFSGADVSFNNVDVNTNLRFTLFFHTQQLVNLDLTNNIGLFAGLAIRNVGLIKEDLYQNVGFLNIDNTHPDYNKTIKLLRENPNYPLC